jgi:hypothetical protein
MRKSATNEFHDAVNAVDQERHLEFGRRQVFAPQNRAARLDHLRRDFDFIAGLSGAQVTHRHPPPLSLRRTHALAKLAARTREAGMPENKLAPELAAQVRDIAEQMTGITDALARAQDRISSLAFIAGNLLADRVLSAADPLAALDSTNQWWRDRMHTGVSDEAVTDVVKITRAIVRDFQGDG